LKTYCGEHRLDFLFTKNSNAVRPLIMNEVICFIRAADTQSQPDHQMKPIYKMWMGPGAGGHEFDTLSAVLQHINHHREIPTGPSGNSPEMQVEWFVTR
jgi:hypothetical protein